MLQKIIEYKATRKNKDFVWKKVQDFENGKVTGEPEWYVTTNNGIFLIRFKTAYISKERYGLLKEELEPLLTQYKGEKLTPQQIEGLEKRLYQLLSKEDYKEDDGKIICIVTNAEKGKIVLETYNVFLRYTEAREKRKK